MVDWLNTVVQGLLLGGLYALFALGLSLVFGVMRLVNIAHGDLILLAAFLAIVITSVLGLHPLLSLVILVPLMFILGYVLQRGLLNFTLGRDILPPLLVTFGLSILIQNGLLEVFSADSRSLPGSGIETASFRLTEHLAVGTLPLIIFATALVLTAGLSPFVLPQGPTLNFVPSETFQPVALVEERGHGPPPIDRSIPRAPPS